MALVHFNVFLHAAKLAQLRLDADALLVSALHDAFRDSDVFFKRLVAGVDHDRAVEPGIDAVIAGLFVAMIEVNGKNRVAKHLFGGADQGFEHPLVGVFPRALRKLDDKWRLALHIAAEQSEDLFHVVYVVCADGEFSVGDLVELLGGNDHEKNCRWLIVDCRFGERTTLERSRFFPIRNQISNPKSVQAPFSNTGRSTLTEVPCGLESTSTRPL